MVSNRRAIGEALVHAGVITNEQLNVALRQVEGNPLRLCSRLYVTGQAPEEALVKMLAQHLGYPGIVLSQSKIDLEHITLVPEKIATEEMIFPLGIRENRLIVALADPHDENVLNELAFVTGKEISPVVGLQVKIQNAVSEAYRLKAQGEQFLTGEHYDRNKTDGNGLAIMAEENEIEIDITFEDAVEERPASSEREKVEEDLSAFKQEEGTPAKTVLIVDDEKEILNLLSKVVSNMGLIPVTADRGRAALNAIKQFAPDLIILDAMLPEVHGFDICKKVKQSKRFSKTPVIMISAIYTGWQFAEDIKNTIGADYFLEKPFNIAELKKIINDVIKQSAPNKENDESKQEEVIYNQAAVLIRGKQYADAIPILRQATNEYPFSARVKFLLGTAYEGEGNIYGALSAYEDAVKLQPIMFVALKSLAGLYQKMGFRHKSVEMWERALKAAPNEELKSKIRNLLLKLI